MKIILPDGSNKELEANSNGFDLAKSISNSLAKVAVALTINGELSDMRTELQDGDEVAIITKQQEESLEVLRHTTAHVLANAVQNLFPTAKIAIGPTIENGFYYDFYVPDKTISVTDLESIEKEMKRIIKSGLKVQKNFIKNVDSTLQEYNNNGEVFKARLLEKYRDSIPTSYGFYNENKLVWSDLCRGPHLPKLTDIKAFKLMSVSSAYWNADESAESLQRVYGTAWWSQEDLDAYLTRLEEAEKRDHRKLSKQHQLFSTHDEAGPGLIFWHPKLGFLRTRVEELWRTLHEKADYQIVYTPHIARSELWDISGHTDHYKDNMYSLESIDEQEYILKPMNCPFHILIYKSQPHSYRELPIRLAEMGTVYRNERSGALHGLARVRGFTQDDAHVFCTEDQLVSEVCDIMKLVENIYNTFGLKYTAELSTRPEDKIGDDSVWDVSEKALEEALKQTNMPYEINAGDGAFYGPKIDFKLQDAIGREWQGATIQVDFNLPERFDLKYSDQDGTLKRPVMLHRAIFGSLERFTALLIENYSGAFPSWLCETQVKVLPITDRSEDYAQTVIDKLKEAGIRVKGDFRSEKVQAKIRDAQLEQVPHMLIIGDKEQENNQVAVRERRQGDIGVMSVEEFIASIQ